MVKSSLEEVERNKKSPSSLSHTKKPQFSIVVCFMLCRHASFSAASLLHFCSISYLLLVPTLIQQQEEEGEGHEEVAERAPLQQLEQLLACCNAVVVVAAGSGTRQQQGEGQGGLGIEVDGVVVEDEERKVLDSLEHHHHHHHRISAELLFHHHHHHHHLQNLQTILGFQRAELWEAAPALYLKRGVEAGAR